MRNLFLMLCMPMLVSCISVEKLSKTINQKYAGKNFDEFVINHGAPNNKYQLTNGDIAYTWNSGTRTAMAPGFATTQVNGNTANTNFFGGGDVSMYCELQIITDGTNNVKTLKVMKDTVGWITDSRCYDIFSK